jgi:hypothetical protein
VVGKGGLALDNLFGSGRKFLATAIRQTCEIRTKAEFAPQIALSETPFDALEIWEIEWMEPGLVATCLGAKSLPFQLLYREHLFSTFQQLGASAFA